MRDYALVTAAYWSFTITDGALRMLVLLHLAATGHTPLAIASLFLFYELFGVVTNLVGGWLGARSGLTLTLFAGLALQILACGSLAVPEAWLTVPYVMVSQGLSGIAKDLTKMSAKSYIKLVVPQGDGPRLLRWVSLLTGSKNTLKGVGFFLGAALLSRVGFQGAVGGMAAALVVPLVVCIAFLPRAAGRTVAKPRWKALLSNDARVNRLSLARFFLFGARDVWFVLALPLFLSETLGWSFYEVGGFLALWVIGYGIVQTVAPRFVGAAPHGDAPRAPPTAASLAHWTGLLALPTATITAALWLGVPPGPALMVGLAFFGFVFAANSAIHSYLIVHYAPPDRVSMTVGFYYMANAAGRLLGTVLSGAVFQWAGGGLAGLIACVATALALVLLSRIGCTALVRTERSL